MSSRRSSAGNRLIHAVLSLILFQFYFKLNVTHNKSLKEFAVVVLLLQEVTVVGEINIISNVKADNLP